MHTLKNEEVINYNSSQCLQREARIFRSWTHASWCILMVEKAQNGEFNTRKQVVSEEMHNWVVSYCVKRAIQYWEVVIINQWINQNQSRSTSARCKKSKSHLSKIDWDAWRLCTVRENWGDLFNNTAVIHFDSVRCKDPFTFKLKQYINHKQYVTKYAIMGELISAISLSLRLVNTSASAFNLWKTHLTWHWQLCCEYLRSVHPLLWWTARKQMHQWICSMMHLRKLHFALWSRLWSGFY